MPLRFARRAYFAAPLEFTNPGSSAANQWFGRTAVVSHTLGVSAVVSTGLVAADSLIFTQVELDSAVKSYGAVLPMFAVSTKSPNGFFRIEAVNSIGTATTGSYTVAWLICNPAGTV